MFLTEAMLWAMVAGAIPIIVHFSLKQKPKSIVFPPMQFIKEAFKRSSRSFQLRHIFLLCLRILALVLFALILARPSVESELMAGTQGRASVILIIDDSPSMGAGERGDTFFDRAKKRALKQWENLREGDSVALVFVSDPVAQFTINLPEIKRRIDDARLSNISGSCSDALSHAYQMMAEQRRRMPDADGLIYFFSDYQNTAWKRSAVENVLPDVVLYPVSVFDSVENSGIVSVSSDVSARKGVKFVSEFTVASTNKEPATLDVVFAVDGEICAREKMPGVSRNQNSSLSFAHNFVKYGLRKCEVRLDMKDAFTADNKYYFTVNVEAPPDALFVTNDQREGRDNSLYYLKVLFSPMSTMEKRVKFHGKTSAEAEQLNFADYGIIFLVNPDNNISEAFWKKIYGFVAGGGGLVIFSGDRTGPASFTHAAGLIPGQIGDNAKALKGTDGYKFRLDDEAHPVMKAIFSKGTMRSVLGGYRCREFTKVNAVRADGRNRVLLRFSDTERSPALIERKVGKGAIFFFTTSANAVWTDFYDDGFVFPSLMFKVVDYLARSEGRRFKANPGDSMTIPLPFGQDKIKVFLEMPDKDVIQIPLSEGRALISGLTQVGNYQITVQNEKKELATFGLSVNLDGRELDLRPIAEKGGIGRELKSLIPKANIPNVEDEKIDASKKPYEIFKYILILLVFVLLLESFLSNRFYKE